jgi:diaminopimelate decarboxylase
MAEEVGVAELAERYGTPLFVYSAATLRRHFHAFDSAFESIPHLTCYSAKSNSNLSVLRLLQQEGAGADIVSGGELQRALEAGIAPEKIVFSGVGKRVDEMDAALQAGILMFNVESEQELLALSQRALNLGTTAPVSLRINPDVDPETHPYISTGLKKNKFGIDIARAFDLYIQANELLGLDPVGIDCHIGSQLTRISPFLDALERLKDLYRRLHGAGVNIRYLDLGGGLGITYEEEEPPHPAQFGRALTEALQDLDLTLILEPGRVISGNAGIMVTRTLYVKQSDAKTFFIVDAAMNDLIRPAFYQAYHRAAEVRRGGRPQVRADVVGPICETGDFLAQDRLMPEVRPGELLAFFSAGAYGFAMSSQYNTRPRAAEVLVDGSEARLVRRRESVDELLAPERDYLR